MNPRSLLSLAFLLWACQSQSSSKGKDPAGHALRIGYTNIEVILPLLPEAQAVDSQLKVYERSLFLPIQQKQAQLEKQYQAFMDLQQKGLLAPVDAEKRQADLMKLNEEVQRLQMQAQDKLFQRRAELFRPLSEKIQKAIDELAQAERYDYIFNNSNATGVALLLHAPKSDDVTKRLLERLGVSADTLLDETPQ